MSDKLATIDPGYEKGRRDGLIEAAAWLEDAASKHVRDTEAWKWLHGSADFMRAHAGLKMPLPKVQR